MHCLRLINALDRSQFQPVVALAQSGGSYEAALADDVPVYGLNPAGVSSSPLSMVRAIAPLRRLIQAQQPDVVCAFLDHANLAAIAACRGCPSAPNCWCAPKIRPSANTIVPGTRSIAPCEGCWPTSSLRPMA